MLPLVIYLILVKEDPMCCDIISAHIAQFFNKHLENLGDNNSETYLIVKDKSALKCMVDVINFTRIQNITKNT